MIRRIDSPMLGMTDINVLKLLGGERSTVQFPRRLREIRRTEKHAHLGYLILKTRAIDEIATRVGCSASFLLGLIGVTTRTASRRKVKGMLSAEESDRLYRIARVVRYAELVFGSEEKAHAWLQEPSQAFGMHAPISLLRSDMGAEAVTEELNRIDWGDLY
jgi:putative toxin-antitoxin system antitoxin component (TIGR02293 family)